MQAAITIVNATNITKIPLNAVTPVPADNLLRQLLWGYRASLQYINANRRVPDFFCMTKDPVPTTGIYLGVNAKDSDGKDILGTLSTEVAFAPGEAQNSYLEICSRQLIVFSERGDDTVYATSSADRLTIAQKRGDTPIQREKTWFHGVNNDMWLSDRRVTTYGIKCGTSAVGDFIRSTIGWGQQAGRAIVFAHVGDCPATMTPQYELSAAIGTQALWQPYLDISTLQLSDVFKGWQPTCVSDKRYIGHVIEVVRQLVTTTLNQPIVVYLTGLDDLIYPDESSVEGLAAILRTAVANHIGMIVETDSTRMQELLNAPIENELENDEESFNEAMQELQEELDASEAGDYL